MSDENALFRAVVNFGHATKRHKHTSTSQPHQKRQGWGVGCEVGCGGKHSERSLQTPESEKRMWREVKSGNGGHNLLTSRMGQSPALARVDVTIRDPSLHNGMLLFHTACLSGPGITMTEGEHVD